MTTATLTDTAATELVDRVAALAAAVRDDQRAVRDLLADCTRTDLVALVVAAAAMLPADVDPDAALTWLTTPDPKSWPTPLVVSEAARFEAGAADPVAAGAFSELERRLRVTEAHARRDGAQAPRERVVTLSRAYRGGSARSVAPTARVAALRAGVA